MTRRRFRTVRPPRFQRDIIDIATYIAQDSLSASDRFVAAVERTVARLAEHPFAGTPYPLTHPDLADIRTVAVTRFRRYLIFYRVIDGEVQLVRLVHGARDIPTLLAEIPGEPPNEG
jgi:toxin ParE1/3/4